ncbi:hypothetical protein [Agaribacter marinus]|uniref:Uncharacterized protein n=1 Tax=Agaribacter marinus TaxID=1431249 RepID=A0AA37T4J4_9ALTE|nr:hypothetical protein [Agaribacter marinus]GLR71245.1 hypothetical protein GCM10007852_21530 [Agaribacter marinus]
MQKNSPQLQDGADFQGYEREIVGNEEGLKNLINACEYAIINGNYSGNDLGTYRGVTKKNDKFFEDNEESKWTLHGLPFVKQ